MATYRYLFYDLLSNAPLAELPMKRVVFDSPLNGVGSYVGYLPLADPSIEQLQVYSATVPGRTALYIDRGGTLVWGGIVVSRKFSQGQNVYGSVGPFTMEIQAAEFMWYFLNKRVIAADTIFTNAEQMTIPGALINTAQAVRNGSIGVNVPSFPASGILRTQTWQGTEKKKVGQAIIDMSQLDQGFDWAIQVGYGIGGQPAGVPGKQLQLGYPRLGVPFTTSGWMFEFPGNIVDYLWPEDASAQAITAYVQGQGTGTNMIQSSNTITSLLDAGYPLLEDVFVLKDQTDPNAVAARAVSAAKAFSLPVTLPVIMVRADQEPVLGSYAVGDDANIRITSPQYPAIAPSVGYDVFWRIIGRRVEPQQAENSKPERVFLTLGAVPV